MAFEVLDQNITQLFKNDDTFFYTKISKELCLERIALGTINKRYSILCRSNAGLESFYW